MITVAKETKDGWLLNGAKMWITNGSTASVAIVWAKTGKLDDVESIRGFIVPADTKGFSAKDQKGKLSLRASDSFPFWSLAEKPSKAAGPQNQLGPTA